MNEYVYMNEYEREATQKYEGTYTAEEIELNKKLAEECSKTEIDIEYIEELLKQGADPLGGTAICGWDLLDHVYGDEVLFYKWDSDDGDLVRLTELFLKYGMDIDKPRVPYDQENSINPLWHFAHSWSKNAAEALKLLLDHGLSADSFAEFWDHATIDFGLDYGDPQKDEFWNEVYRWTFKMLFLGASYDHVRDNDEYLREFICYEYNSYDIHKLRNWDSFEYFFDTSYCKHVPHIYGSILHIYEKSTGAEVWKMGVGAEARELLFTSQV